MEQENSSIMMNNRINEALIFAEIQEISWERILLHMDVQITRKDYAADRDLQFYMVAGFFKANAIFDALRGENDLWHLTLNVTNPGYCFCLPTGHYSVVVCDGKDILSMAQVSTELAPKLFEKSRFFQHNGKTTAYCVNISLKNREDGLFPEFYIYGAQRAGLKVFNQDNTLKQEKTESAKGLTQEDKEWARELYSFVREDFQNKQQKTVLFMSEQNEIMKYNLEAVYNQMLVRGLDKEFEILQSFSPYATMDQKSQQEFLEKLAKADYIFIDDYCPTFDWLTLDEEQTLVQLWHAGAGYKAVGYSRWGHIGGTPPISCHRQYKYSITPSRNIASFFSEQYGINVSQILPTGMPRMDSYLNLEYRKEKTKRLYELFPICQGKKVILFAPTYRGTSRGNAHYPYKMIDFKRLYEFCGEDYVVLFRMHPWVPTEVPIKKEYLGRFLDVGKYPDINDLFYITDILITDYSSAISEYAIMGKPALFYAFDELQISYVRGFHRDYKSNTPGKVCHTFAELIMALESGDFEFEKMESYVKNHFDYFDTHSSDRVIDWIMLDQMPEEIKTLLQADREKVNLLKKLDFAAMKKVKKKAEKEELRIEIQPTD